MYMVLMISPEQPTSKPLCFACTMHCLQVTKGYDSEVRKIANKLVKEMSLRGMKVAGILLCISVI